MNCPYMVVYWKDPSETPRFLFLSELKSAQLVAEDLQSQLYTVRIIDLTLETDENGRHV
jgi:hypothetical protein